MRWSRLSQTSRVDFPGRMQAGGPDTAQLDEALAEAQEQVRALIGAEPEFSSPAVPLPMVNSKTR